MARIRTIKPELPSDPSLAACSRDARLTFTYLITQSDDYGYIPAAPRQLVGLLYPHDDDVTPAMVGAWIAELVRAGLCAWAWTTDGLPLVHLVGWEQHQRIDNRRKAVLSARLNPDKSDPPAYVNNVLAAVRGGLAANRGESRLEPPTSDQGPPTKDLGPVPPTTPAFSDEKAPRGGWPARIAAQWTREVGVIREGKVGTDLKGFVRLYPSPDAAERALAVAIPNYVATCRRRDEQPHWSKFASNIAGHLPAMLLPPERAA